MASATVRNSRFWWTGAVALSLLAIAGWQAQGQNRAPAKNPPQEKKSGEKPADDKTTQSTITTFVSYPQVKVINDQIVAEWKANNLKPSERASHFEFNSRAVLDIRARLPTPHD